MKKRSSPCSYKATAFFHGFQQPIDQAVELGKLEACKIVGQQKVGANGVPFGTVAFGETSVEFRKSGEVKMNVFSYSEV